MAPSNGNQIAVRAENLPQLAGEMTFEQTMSLGAVLAQSGYFADAREAAQAVVKVMAGRELGIPPIAAMNGIYIVQGRPALSAVSMAGLVKRSGRYNYAIGRHTNEVCSITFYERFGNEWKEIGTSTFSLEDARKAGTQNLQKFPRNMLFARAMSNGVKWYCPDLAMGPLYTPDELGMTIDAETGEVLPPPSSPSLPPSLTPAASKRQEYNLLVNTEGFWPNEKDKPAMQECLESLTGRPISDLKALTGEDLAAARAELEARNAARKRYYAVRTEQGKGKVDDEADRAYLGYLLGKEVKSRRFLTAAEWQAATDRMESDGAPPTAAPEAEEEDDPFAGEELPGLPAAATTGPRGPAH